MADLHLALSESSLTLSLIIKYSRLVHIMKVLFKYYCSMQAFCKFWLRVLQRRWTHIFIPGNGRKEGKETPAGHISVLHKSQSAPSSACCWNSSQQRGRLICRRTSQGDVKCTGKIEARIDFIALSAVFFTEAFESNNLMDPQ